MMLVLTIAVAVISSAIASVTGFGIGSLLTPVLAIDLGIKLAVAVVAIPHFVATAVRFFTLYRKADRHLLVRFGLASAFGGLAGALINTYISAAPLVIIFGLLLAFAGWGSVTGRANQFRLRGRWALAAGGLSGLLGGMVGNQGGIRSAALLGSHLDKESLVATATAIALLVDVARTPVYLVTQGSDVLSQWPLILSLCGGVVVGTFLGWRLLLRIREAWFRRIVGIVVLLLGLYMLYQGTVALI
jgi:uncharacterized protein